MTTRRDFLALSALSAVLFDATTHVFAQQGRIRKIGVLTSRPTTSDVWEAFKAGMRDQGYVEGKNLRIEWRNVEGRFERYQPLAEELVKAGVEVIVTHSNNAVLAIRKATTTVPIVAAAFGDPVVAGVAASLARPGGNVTGISIVSEGTAFKLIELAREMLPKGARIAVVGNPDSQGHRRVVPDMELVFSKVGIKTIATWARSPQDIDTAFATMARDRTEAAIVLLEPFLGSRNVQIAEIALQRKIATYTQSHEFADAGCLLSYGANLPALFRQAAVFVDKILKGMKPADLPIEQATRFELIVNLRTARALGITVPQTILVRADKVIE